MKYKWSEKDGIVDKNGDVIFDLVAINATKKARRETGKRLAEQMNECPDVLRGVCRYGPHCLDCEKWW